jgi:hypothetical protein
MKSTSDLVGSSVCECCRNTFPMQSLRVFGTNLDALLQRDQKRADGIIVPIFVHAGSSECC